MDGREQILQEKLERLLKEAAEAAVELDRQSGRIVGVPHYSVIEARAHHVAKALHATDQDRWDQYQVWMRGCWQGEVDQVLEELRVWQQKIGEPPQDAAENDPRAILAERATTSAPAPAAPSHDVPNPPD